MLENNLLRINTTVRKKINKSNEQIKRHVVAPTLGSKSNAEGC